MKMYVVMNSFDNGDAYEEHAYFYDSFKGLFSTKELATEFAKHKASEAFNDLTVNGDDSTHWYVFTISNIRMDETGMKVMFDAYKYSGFIEYYVVEVEVDQEWRPTCND